MRLDKYLKTARILKRRTVSKELADQELTVRVTMIQKQANKNDASLMFEVIEEKLIKKEEVKDILAEQ